MKFIRLPRFGWLVAVMCVPVVLVGGEIMEQELGSFRRPAGDAAESAVAERAEGIVAELAGTASFAKWKRFEDDKVTFSYPDHEAIRVEVKRGEPVPVDGDRVSDVDTSFSRAYRISAGGETLLVLMYTEADWLDDGVCFCGEVVYDRFDWARFPVVSLVDTRSTTGYKPASLRDAREAVGEGVLGG